MTMLENVAQAMERILLPKLSQIEEQLKSLRELMEEKFKSVDQRFKDIDQRFKDMDQRFRDMDAKLDIRFTALEDKLDLHRRLSILEERQKQNQPSPSN